MPRLNEIPVVNARGVQRRMRLFRWDDPGSFLQEVGPWALSKIKFKWEGAGERGYCGQGLKIEMRLVFFFFFPL